MILTLMNWWWKLGGALLLAAAAACGPAAPRESGPLRVVATFSIVGDLARNVGGEHIALTVLAGPGADAHTFIPTARDAAAVAQAQVVLENGLDFETWLDDLYAASGSTATRAVVSAGVSTLSGEAGYGVDEHAEDDEHGHGAVDPHIWHSVANAILMTNNIRDALIAADPANAAAYRANAAAYAAQLQVLDDWIFAEVARLPAERRKLVTTHDTFGYFADRYGFEVAGTVLPASTEGASPSAQELAALVEAVRAAGVPAVFAENVAASGLLSQVAHEAGVEVVASLFTDALGPEGSGAPTYIEMMRYNVTTIVQALGG